LQRGQRLLEADYNCLVKGVSVVTARRHAQVIEEHMRAGAQMLLVQDYDGAALEPNV
jgi:fructose-1,6-bisphosphatase/sedoheptulose 1,7-bisphosphatase-like protein